MKTNLRGRIREFVQSEEGKVGIKSPLTIGIAAASLLAAQAIIGTTPAFACLGSTDCADDFVCGDMVEQYVNQGPGLPEHCWWEGVCIKDH